MRYTLIFALTSVLFFSGLYGLILAVDPYNKFGYNLFGFETKAVDFARENKFNQVEHAKKNYSLFLMGSSSAHRYRTSDMNRLTGLASYNYSTQSATPEDYIAMTRHILKKGFPIKMLLLSIDFEAMNKTVKTDDMFYSSPLKNFLSEVPKDELKADLFNNSYLTLEAIRDSFQVIWVNNFGKANHSYLDDGDHIVEPKPKKLKLSQFSYRDYEIDQNRLKYLRLIKELGDKNNFKVIVFTSPLTKDHLDKLERDPHLVAKLAEMKQELVKIFGELHDFNNHGIDPYNSPEYFRDGNHANHDFSNTVLERIFGKEIPGNPEFGKLLR